MFQTLIGLSFHDKYLCITRRFYIEWLQKQFIISPSFLNVSVENKFSCFYSSIFLFHRQKFLCRSWHRKKVLKFIWQLFYTTTFPIYYISSDTFLLKNKFYHLHKHNNTSLKQVIPLILDQSLPTHVSQFFYDLCYLSYSYSRWEKANIFCCYIFLDDT